MTGIDQNKILIFDLDGTISDPKEGITKSINYALKQNGFETFAQDDLEFCIGPPLDQSFQILVNNDDPGLLTRLIEAYRDRYADKGYRENILYPGIKKTLAQLYSNPEITLGLCTSKRIDFAEQILSMFGLLDWFEFLSGGEIGMNKGRQLAALLKDGTISKKNAIMIGDTRFDLIAANENSLLSAGVLWGYGPVEELSALNPQYMFKAPEQLLTLGDL